MWVPLFEDCVPHDKDPLLFFTGPQNGLVVHSFLVFVLRV